MPEIIIKISERSYNLLKGLAKGGSFKNESKNKVSKDKKKHVLCYPYLLNRNGILITEKEFSAFVT